MREMRRDGTPVWKRGRGMKNCELDVALFILDVMAPVVLFEKFRGIHLILCFPSVIGLRVSLPLEEILESFVLPEVAMTSDGFHLVFHFSVDKVRWGSREVRAVGVRFDVWG
jgi:hypothetical protein